MPKFTVKYDFSDVATALNQFQSDVVAQIDKVGKEAVDYAVANGNYHDCTGNLRRSNKYTADAGGLELTNTAEYASNVEARGYDVIGGAALYAEQQLKEIFE